MATDAESAPNEHLSNEPDTDSSDLGQDNDGFASDMWDGTTSEEEDTQVSADAQPQRGTAGANQQGASQAFDPTKVNLTRVDINSVPEEYRPFVQSAQEQFKGLQTTLNERDQAIAQLNQRLSSVEQNAQPQVRQQQGQQPVTTPRSVYQGYEYLGDTSHLSPQEREEFYAGATQVDTIVSHAMQPYKQYLDAMPQIVEALGVVLQGYQQTQTQTVEQEWQSLASMYGVPNIDQYKEGTNTLMQTVNPATGKNFTRQEAFERFYGVSAEQAQRIRAQHTQARNGAKRLVGGGSPPPTTGTPRPRHPSSGEVADRMAMAGWPE